MRAVRAECRGHDPPPVNLNKMQLVKTIYLFFLLLWEALRFSVVAMLHGKRGNDRTYDDDAVTLNKIEKWRGGL